VYCVQRRFHSRDNERNDEKLSVTFYKLPSLKRATNKKERAQRETALGMLPALFSRSAEIKELSRTCHSDDNGVTIRYTFHILRLPMISRSRDVPRNALRINLIIPGGITVCFLLALFNQPLIRGSAITTYRSFNYSATLTAARGYSADTAYVFSVISSIAPNRAMPNATCKGRITLPAATVTAALDHRSPEGSYLFVSRLILWHTLHAP